MKKNISITILSLFSLSILAGCAGNSGSYPPIYRAENPIFTSPALGAIATVELGENMYETYMCDSYEVTLLDPPENKASYYWLALGPILGGAGMLSQKALNNNNGFNSQNRSGYILKGWPEHGWRMICNTSNECIIDVENNNSFTHTASYPDDELSEIKTPIKYSIFPKLQRYGENSFKVEALYQGKFGDNIKISFREFKNDFARPAFTQDIGYELNKTGSTTIGFKGLRIEIIEATNLGVKYKVIKNYNL